jgi:hypothetical protein
MVSCAVRGAEGRAGGFTGGLPCGLTAGATGFCAVAGAAIPGIEGAIFVFLTRAMKPSMCGRRGKKALGLYVIHGTKAMRFNGLSSA